MTTPGNGLYRQVTLVTENYLGPAAERFVARQITYHLDKSPHELTQSDLPKLIEWAKLTFGLLTEDPRIINEYVAKLNELSEATAVPPNGGQPNHVEQSAR